MHLESSYADRIIKGDISAFEKFYKLYFQRLKNFATMFLDQSDQAEDIVQESFCALWTSRDKIKPEQSLEGFVFTMVRNRCLNVIKQKDVHEKFIDFALQYEYISQAYHTDFDLNDSDEKHDLLGEIKDAIEKLPDKRKRVFTLSRIDGLSNKEIASEVGITVKGVERHITKAHEFLRKDLKHLAPVILQIFMFL
ncbi:RNA polymerase sigma-70 factor [Marinilabiliaceae bacterium JC017]|nr:RNA polymerase sigma-70 factor [Marinilabiliaceae bacterium JC017]